METKSNYRTPVLLLFMLLIVGLRVIAPLSPDFKSIANFSGIGAVALFGGAYFKNTISAFLLPVLVLLISRSRACRNHGYGLWLLPRLVLHLYCLYLNGFGG
ncbi:DUF6580 family putative transport protein [Pedobacter sp. UC225_65]|uniref:DUF6580 family putative transport protein n=1 Tax=Pedobacter sp. UC225_65 TaxID=3350173 RepID=UPI00366DACD0